jgi:hypothetical protein
LQRTGPRVAAPWIVLYVKSEPATCLQIAIVIINVFINMMVASAGYVIPKQQIPKFWQFAYWIK